jgi:hypothetical protein
MIDELKYYELEHIIRHGKQPDNPILLNMYLEMTHNKVQKKLANQCKRNVLVRALRTLLDTICDTYVAYHWRQVCLDNIYKPQLSLDRLCNSEQNRIDNLRFRYELTALSHYFL